MTAQDYPVQFGYAAQDGTYYGPNGSVGPYHKGNDRYTPTGTPIVIDGVTIGKTGATGLVSGPHLHTQAWTGSVGNTQDPSPYDFKPGKVVAAGTASQWGNYITIDVGGVNLTYAHLSQINVGVGQVIGTTGGTMTTDKGQLDRLYMAVLQRTRAAGEGEDVYLGKDSGFVFDDLYKSAERARTLQTKAENLDKLNAQITSLKTELANKPTTQPSADKYVALTDVLGKLYIKQ